MSDRSEVNRSNALKSTGPKTSQGKRKSSQNAIKHGLFAKDVLITGEDSEQFRLHKSGLIRRLNPRDVLELHLVEQIVVDTWTIRRVRAAEQELYADAKIEARESDYNWGEYLKNPGKKKSADKQTPAGCLSRLFDSKKLDRLNSYQRRLSSSFHRCLKELRELRREKDNPDEPLTDLSAAVICDMLSDPEEPTAQNEAISNASDGVEETCAAAPPSIPEQLDTSSSLERRIEQRMNEENDPPGVPKAA